MPQLLTFDEARLEAQILKAPIIRRVRMPDTSVAVVRFGPRGGHQILTGARAFLIGDRVRLRGFEGRVIGVPRDSSPHYGYIPDSMLCIRMHGGDTLASYRECVLVI